MIVMLGGDDCIPGWGSHERKVFSLPKNGWDQLIEFDFKVYGSWSRGPDLGPLGRKGHFFGFREEV